MHVNANSALAFNSAPATEVFCCFSAQCLAFSAGSVTPALLLRRFQMFDSSATRPYTVSAMACWKRAADLGYMTLDGNGKVRRWQASVRQTPPLNAQFAENLSQDNLPLPS